MRFVYLLVLLASFVFAEEEHGICKLDTLDTESATECIQRVLKKDPKNVRCTIKLSNIYLKEGELSKGFDLIYKAYNLNPEYVSKSVVSSILPFALKVSKLKEKALKSDDYNSWNEIADSFYEMGVYKEALGAYEKSVDINPEQVDSRFKLSICFKKTGQTYKAIEQLKYVLSLESEHFYANYYMGKILKYSIKDVINSKKYFQKARDVLEKNQKVVSKKEYPKFLSDIIYELSK